ncbi:diguanylate cyclase [Methylicorpusculum sp.]|uniref:GGDEF domain-containing response regulator n=2 Tax=Methylicorpusculum sp. TaxID=2713644 RepID=UPI00271CD2AB|nr:diguanylate cyclase [Methylicorpusculum sp.]MDO9238578.1 diguanylate cyclase [Methylicorpusculum sp.]
MLRFERNKRELYMPVKEYQQTILIIDDAKENIVVLSRLLKSHGNIIFAQNGEEGLLSAMQSIPDLILLDISMPGLDGFEVLMHLKQSPSTADLPVIFITGIPDSDTEEKGLTLGAVDYITKPFSSAVVKARVRHQLKLQRLTRALKEANTRLTLLAMTDPLTGAHNRRYFIDMLKNEMSRARRYHHPMSLMVLDIDRFKAINDSFGHDVGDQVIIEVVKTSSEVLRKNDVFSRFGGEEFTILMPETTLEEAAQIAGRLCEKVSETQITTNDHQINFTISGGVAQLEDGDQTPEAILKRADIALYQAKQQGRNRIVVAGMNNNG